MPLTFVVPIYPKLTVSERHYLEIFVYQRLPKGTKSVHNTNKRPWVKLGDHPIDFYQTHTWLMALRWCLLPQILRISVKKYIGNGWVFIYTLKWCVDVTAPIFTKLTVKKLHFEFHENPTNANARPRTDGCGFHVVISVFYFFTS
jgi:hypothetical protein